jgi:hypothetical protein
MFPNLFSRLIGQAAFISWLSFLTGLAIVATATAVPAQLSDEPMQFMLVHADLGSGGCRADGSCVDWIAAEGRIDRTSPATLRKLLSNIGDRKLPIVLRSRGGDVRAALELGRLIRKRGLPVAVGGTRLRYCPENEPLCAKGWFDGAKGAVYAAGANCLSACPLVLAGGVRRMFSPYTVVGVHQVTFTYDDERVRYRTEYRIVSGRKHVISRQIISRTTVGQHTSTKMTESLRNQLLAYFKEMGIDKSLLDMMLSANPASIRQISQSEGLKIGLETDLAAADDIIAAGACPPGQPLSGCIAPASTMPTARFIQPPFSDQVLVDDILPSSDWIPAGQGRWK